MGSWTRFRNRCSKSACCRAKSHAFRTYGVTILYKMDLALVSGAVEYGVAAITAQGEEVTSMIGEGVIA